MVKISFVRDVHRLAHTIDGTTAAFSGHHHLRIHIDKPAGNRIGWRANNHLDTRLLHFVYNQIHSREVEFPRLLFIGGPSGFRDPDDIDARFLHHRNVFLQTIVRQIFIVIGYSV
ncbi:hypothetical protein SDC9_179629 [bioreactor metagenome]|uniref:Uncharacterized protein n=1 Tax=bioreactor metagenome TaxID=1076179 RepID=A0A645H8P5_9ZZZZ